jgi:hypothetical protein
MNFEQAEANDASVADEGYGEGYTAVRRQFTGLALPSGGETRSHDLERGIGVEGTMVSVGRIATCRSRDAAHPSALTGLL